MRKLVEDAGLAAHVDIDSAGTGAWHAGERADPRSSEEALSRGIHLTSIARQFVVEDFDAFDYVVAMDRSNRRALEGLARSKADREKVSMLRAFDDLADGADVPDPYYGGERGFADVFDICEAGCRGLLAHLRATHGL